MNAPAREFYAALKAYQVARPQLAKDNVAEVEFRSGRRTSYAFAGLPNVLEHLLPSLAKCDLVVTQTTHVADGATWLTTALVHVPSCEGLEAVLRVCDISIVGQPFGSALSFARRYSLLLVGVLAPDDDTDAGDLPNGNNAVTSPRPKTRPPKRPASQADEVHARLVEAVGKAKTVTQLDKLTERSDFVAALDGLDEVQGPLVKAAIGRKRGELVGRAEEHRLSRQAAMLCSKPAFWKWVEEVHGVALTSETEAAAWMHDRYGIASRAALDTDATAAAVFRSDASEFDTWMKAP